MKIGWIAPLGKKCGISVYAQKYAEALYAHADIVACDPAEFVTNRESFLHKLDSCDIVHIQYETSLFASGISNYYHLLCQRIKCRKIVTLHEVYDVLPSVFPRAQITGSGVLRSIKERIWDFRHPHWAAYATHLHNSFYAQTLLVHSQFQKNILVGKGVDKSKLEVIPMPVCTAQNNSIREFAPEKTVMLGASGFINPAYNYELLFAALDRLTFDWKFIWIGGLRRNEDKKLLHWLRNQIDTRKWNDRFRISGWVHQEEYDRLFSDIDIVCAFFSSRSSSQSLMDAIAHNKLIIATRLPLTEDLAGTESLCIITDQDADKAAGRIIEITTDATVRRMLLHGLTNYAEKCSYDNCARRLMNLYREMVAL